MRKNPEQSGDNMKGKLDKRAYTKIYQLLDRATPLKEDCGKLCQKACCHQENQELGMYLLPGEEALFTRKEDWLR